MTPTPPHQPPHHENGFRRLLGVRPTYAEPGRAGVEAQVGAELLQDAGAVHGGVFASMLDCAAADALRGLLGDAETSATIDLDVGFLRPVADGRLSADATVIFRGGSIAVCTAEVKDHTGDVCAVGRATFKISRVRPARSRPSTGHDAHDENGRTTHA